MMNPETAVSARRDDPAPGIEREMAIAWARLATSQVCIPCAHRVTVLKPVAVGPRLPANGA
jgi:hypothetical protein